MENDSPRPLREGNPPVLDYGQRPARLPPWLLRLSRRLAWFLGVLSLLLAVARLGVRLAYPPLPLQALAYNIGDMGIYGGETTIFAERSKLTASANSPEFRITFEGRNTLHSTFGSYWVVEGRELGWWPWDIRYHDNVTTGPDGLIVTTSSRSRTAIINYAAKRIVYSHADRTVKVDGVSYSATFTPVYLRIALDGTVKLQEGPIVPTYQDYLKSLRP